MAIKIDLLPASVKLRRDLRRTITASLITIALVGSGLALIYKQRQLELETAKTNQATAEARAQQVDVAVAARNVAEGKTTPIAQAVGFMVNSSKTGPERAALLNLVRQYIYQDAIVSTIDISDGQKVTINATVKTPDEYARFLLNLRRATGTLFKSPPVASGPGGFANGAVPFGLPNSTQTVPIIYPVAVVAEGILMNPVQVPPDPVAGAAPAGAGGFPGGPQFGPAQGGQVGPPAGVQFGPARP